MVKFAMLVIHSGLLLHCLLASITLLIVSIFGLDLGNTQQHKKSYQDNVQLPMVHYMVFIWFNSLLYDNK